MELKIEMNNNGIDNKHIIFEKEIELICAKYNAKIENGAEENETKKSRKKIKYFDDGSLLCCWLFGTKW